MMLGMIKGVNIEYKDGDEIYISSGYGECSGNYFEITSTGTIELDNANVFDGTYPTSEDFIYVYINHDSAEYPSITVDNTSSTDIVASLDEPAWSDSKFGWYRQSVDNTNDRCIGVVWFNGSNIFQFENYEGNFYSGIVKEILSDATPPSADWTFLEGTNYTPVNAVAARMHLFAYDDNTPVKVALRGYDDNNQQIIEQGYDSGIAHTGIIRFPKNGTRDFEWSGFTDDEDFHISIRGYIIER